MAFFDVVHFDGMIKISGVEIEAKLTSDTRTFWNSEEGYAQDSWNYHLTMTNHKSEVDDISGNDAKDKPEYHVPYISQTGFRSDFFVYEKKPKNIGANEVKHMIEGRVKLLIGKNLEYIPKEIKPVEIISKIPKESWVDKDD